MAGRSHDPRKELGQLLTICDAKSLYDHLHSETAGCTADKRTAIEIQIVRASLDAQGGEVRWIDHSNMYADALTKRNGNVPLLQTLMRTARVCITEESATLEKHRLDPKSRSSHSKTIVDPAEQQKNKQASLNLLLSSHSEEWGSAESAPPVHTTHLSRDSGSDVSSPHFTRIQ